ncbi:RnfH family protein [Actimicrobium antarcticum]|uniref:UPF0125 protein GCM10022212_29980 n=1 Tax=Actimicrobium antarcticum TaxID=1051899 RepID=A0ABP7TQJ4_9BURK
MADAGEAMIPVMVCFATPAEQRMISIAMPVGSTIVDAVRQTMPEIGLDHHRVGIFGKLKTPETLLRANDRVEVYRPLLADPKESRRKRARQ